MVPDLLGCPIANKRLLLADQKMGSISSQEWEQNFKSKATELVQRICSGPCLWAEL